jgi:uncharacterized protein YjiS (DUF1127 family)
MKGFQEIAPASALLADNNPPSSAHRGTGSNHPQSNSWRGLLDRWLAWSELKLQRGALRDIADNPHLLRDIGITRQDVLDHVNRPFWR